MKTIMSFFLFIFYAAILVAALLAYYNLQLAKAIHDYIYRKLETLCAARRDC